MKSFLNKFIHKKNIHLDFAATTPVDSKVFLAMKPFLKNYFFNPSSSYLDGQKIKKQIKGYRTSVARFFQCKENEVIFTQGGTESNNLAIIGLAKKTLETQNFTPHMIFSSVEHPAVSECIPVLKKMGVAVDIIEVNEKGIIDLQDLEKKITEHTVLISIILVSNETGVIEPLHKVASYIKKFKNKHHRTFTQYPFLHTDASQALLTQEVYISKLGVDMLSLDGSKIYGPKSSGVLIKKQHIILDPIVYGGGQEAGLRSGTENTASIAGISCALDLIYKKRKKDIVHFKKLKQYFFDEIKRQGIAYTDNGGTSELYVSHIVNICIEGLDSDFAVIQMDEFGINCSAMTACASSKGIPRSEIIEALGKPECAASSLRFSFGRTTKKTDIKKALTALKKVCIKQKCIQK